jgi:hypothetical protein
MRFEEVAQRLKQAPLLFVAKPGEPADQLDMRIADLEDQPVGR